MQSRARFVVIIVFALVISSIAALSALPPGSETETILETNTLINSGTAQNQGDLAAQANAPASVSGTDAQQMVAIEAANASEETVTSEPSANEVSSVEEEVPASGNGSLAGATQGALTTAHPGETIPIPLVGAQATTIADGDIAGLIAAIEAANASGTPTTIELAANGTYTLTQAYNATQYALPHITGDLTINGNGATLSAQPGSASYGVRVTGSMALGGLMLVDFQMIEVYGELSIFNTTMQTDATASPAIAINVFSSGSLTIESTTFSGYQGETIHIASGDVNIADSTFENNWTTGGTIYSEYVHPGGASPVPTVINTRFLNNAVIRTLFTSSAIYVVGDGFNVSNSCFVGNWDVAVMAEVTTSATINAQGNWWGDADGPSGDGDGLWGDNIAGAVDAANFLTTPPAGLDCPTTAVPTSDYVTGVVTDRITGEPVAQGTVGVSYWTDDFYNIAICTNDNGEYAFPNMPRDVPLQVYYLGSPNICGGETRYGAEQWFEAPLTVDGLPNELSETVLPILLTDVQSIAMDINFTVSEFGSLVINVQDASGNTLNDVPVTIYSDWGGVHPRCTTSGILDMTGLIPHGHEFIIAAGGAGDGSCANTSQPEVFHDGSFSLGGATPIVLTGANPSQTITIRLAPTDLTATQFDVAPDNVLAGQARLDFTVANLSAVSAPAFEADVVLSQDEIIGNGDDILVDTLTLAGLAGNTSRAESVLVQLPVATLYTWAQSDDTYLLALVLDPQDTLPELDEGNNSAQGKGIDWDDITYFAWDVDRSGMVTALDVNFVRNRLGQDDPRADLDGNGVVELSDVQAAETRLGASINAALLEWTPDSAPLVVPWANANVNVRLEIVDGNGTPGLQVGETYVINVHVEDQSVQPARSVYAGHINLQFDPTLAQVDGISYASAYTLAQSGTVDNINGWVYALGAVSQNSNPDAETLVVSLQVTALAPGSQQIISRSASSIPQAEIVAYGNDSDQRRGAVFGSIEAYVPPTIDEQVTTVGLYYRGTWMFREENSTGGAESILQFGSDEDGWFPLTGDWDGDGVDGIGLYKEGMFWLRDTTDSGQPETRYYFGPREAGWQPIVGDWNGDGIETVGIYREGQFVLTNSHDNPQVEARFRFGAAATGWLALAGDWNGDGRHGVGVTRNGMVLLTDVFTGAQTIPAFNFGAPQARVLIGDWNGDGTETIGSYNNGLWQLRNSNTQGTPDWQFTFGNSQQNWLPVANYRGGMEGLAALGLSGAPGTDALPTATLEPTTGSPEVTQEMPPTPEPTALQPELTPEVTPEPATEPSERPSESMTPEQTQEP